MIYTTFKIFRVDLLSWTHAQDATFSLPRHLGLQRHQISLNPFSAPTHFQFSACRNSIHFRRRSAAESFPPCIHPRRSFFVRHTGLRPVWSPLQCRKSTRWRFAVSCRRTKAQRKRRETPILRIASHNFFDRSHTWGLPLNLLKRNMTMVVETTFASHPHPSSSYLRKAAYCLLIYSNNRVSSFPALYIYAMCIIFALMLPRSWTRLYLPR
ncbi:hypothetical protein M405DRAFT_569753 [Rhizopogon salebrosus TDB-379]|nr:hypothetical protein M405DRAFT_569753 [Rhizopogon salebrosus TDB-379]